MRNRINIFFFFLNNKYNKNNRNAPLSQSEYYTRTYNTSARAGRDCSSERERKKTGSEHKVRTCRHCGCLLYSYSTTMHIVYSILYIYYYHDRARLIYNGRANVYRLQYRRHRPGMTTRLYNIYYRNRRMSICCTALMREL